MTKDEYTKTLKKYMADNELEQEDGLTYLDGIQDAADLARQLDEPKKVVIPQFAEDWIEEYKQYGFQDKLSTVYWLMQKIGEDDEHLKWLDDEDNQTLFLNAVANGYEVEKEPKYLVKIKGICQENQWLDYEVVGDLLYFELNTESEKYKTYFTKQWLKDNWSEYDAYNNAGLLEFEEVEDD